jgi:isoquinoline 1-oxidoreductase subunit beta
MNSGMSPRGFRAPYDSSRRGFLIAMVGAGVMLGYARVGWAAGGLLEKAPLSPNELFEPTIWYGIDTNGIVTVNIIRAEMGQHVGTSLAQHYGWDVHENRRR